MEMLEKYIDRIISGIFNGSYELIERHEKTSLPTLNDKISYIFSVGLFDVDTYKSVSRLLKNELNEEETNELMDVIAAIAGINQEKTL